MSILPHIPSHLLAAVRAVSGADVTPLLNTLNQPKAYANVPLPLVAQTAHPVKPRDIAYSIHVDAQPDNTAVQYDKSLSVARSILCPSCKGQPQTKCTGCKNRRAINHTTTYRFIIPAGTRHNTVLIAEGFGHADKHGVNGDFVITLKVRRDIDISKTIVVPPSDATKAEGYPLTYPRTILCPTCQGANIPCTECQNRVISQNHNLSVAVKTVLPQVLNQIPYGKGERSLIFDYPDQGHFHLATRSYGNLNLKVVIESPDQWDKQQPLIAFTNDEEINGPTYSLSLGNAMEGIFTFGGIGSGKTSGSLRLIAKALLRKGLGGLVLCVKKEEAGDWLNLCKKYNRLNDVIHITLDGPYVINALEYELASTGITENGVNLINTLTEIGGGQKSEGGSNEEWKQASKQLLRNVLDLLTLAGEPVSFRNIHNVRVSLPRTLQTATSDTFLAACYAHSLLLRATGAKHSDIQKDDLELVKHYLFNEWPSKEKMQTGITMMLTGIMDSFTRGQFAALFTQWGDERKKTISVTPDLALEGAIIIVDLPVATLGHAGRLGNILWKYLYQQAADRRGSGHKPSFCYADEYQKVFSIRDVDFQTTCRSLGIINISATQNIPNLMGTIGSEHHVNSLLGNYNTMIFHSNDEPKTNAWASELFGKIKKVTGSSSQRSKDQRDKVQISTTTNKGDAPAVEPTDFYKLKMGGKPHCTTEAYFFNKAISYKSGRSYAKLTIPQTFL